MTTKPLSGPPRSRLDPEPILRRDFLGLAALGSAGAALAFAVAGMARLPRAAVLPSPSKKFKVALPETVVAGAPFVPAGRSCALFRDGEGVWAISTVCTHLGCIVRAEADGFHCPCHGSVFAPDGSVVRGPAPKALPWLKVKAAGSGLYIVDSGTNVAAGTKETA